jgi:hypothetical protein
MAALKGTDTIIATIRALLDACMTIWGDDFKKAVTFDQFLHVSFLLK